MHKSLNTKSIITRVQLFNKLKIERVTIMMVVYFTEQLWIMSEIILPGISHALM